MAKIGSAPVVVAVAAAAAAGDDFCLWSECEGVAAHCGVWTAAVGANLQAMTFLRVRRRRGIDPVIFADPGEGRDRELLGSNLVTSRLDLGTVVAGCDVVDWAMHAASLDWGCCTGFWWVSYCQ